MDSRLVVRLGLDEDELPPSRAVPVTADRLPCSSFSNRVSKPGRLPVDDEIDIRWADYEQYLKKAMPMYFASNRLSSGSTR